MSATQREVLDVEVTLATLEYDSGDLIPRDGEVSLEVTAERSSGKVTISLDGYDEEVTPDQARFAAAALIEAACLAEAAPPFDPQHGDVVCIVRDGRGHQIPTGTIVQVIKPATDDVWAEGVGARLVTSNVSVREWGSTRPGRAVCRSVEVSDLAPLPA